MSKTIMVVDDAPSIRQILSLALQAEGYDVIEAEDGQQALSKLDGRKISLVISDVNMPNMDGISFVKAAKQLPAYKFTPFLMLTAESGVDKQVAGRVAGANAWLLKPFQPDILLSAISRFI